MNTETSAPVETSSLPAVANPNAVAATLAMRFKVPGDTVNKSTADLPDDQRSAIRGFHAYCAEQNLSLEEAAHLIRYDSSTLHRVFHGRYDGNMQNITKEINTFLSLMNERRSGRKIDYIETDLSKRIFKICDAALEFQRIAFIIGETQVGKSTALLRYRDTHNHGQTIYVSMPTGGAKTLFLMYLAKALRISPQAKPRELIRRLVDSFDDRMLLIVDEAHQCVFGKCEASGVSTMEFIRELHDATHCGIVICGTQVFDQELESGRFSGILKQMKRRRLVKAILPSTPSQKDLATFAAAYNLEPATGEALQLQTEVIRDEALGMWLTLLRMAAKLANKASKPMSWAYVLKAHAGLKSLERAA